MTPAAIALANQAIAANLAGGLEEVAKVLEEHLKHEAYQERCRAMFLIAKYAGCIADGEGTCKCFACRVDGAIMGYAKVSIDPSQTELPSTEAKGPASAKQTSPLMPLWVPCGAVPCSNTSRTHRGRWWAEDALRPVGKHGVVVQVVRPVWVCSSCIPLRPPTQANGRAEEADA